MEKEDETVRFPTKLDPAAIYERLAGVRDAAQQSGLPEIAALLKDVEAMIPAEIGKVVIRSMGLIGGKPEHQGLAKQLQIIAMNLKNLK
ncbi:MAG: hypothetical protein EXR31_05610 [Betaproteobacteria bacterium]|nr:hypothetical protein [Betaproteobacteria bacterium]